METTWDEPLKPYDPKDDWEDKCLVWAWNDNHIASRDLLVWDSHNKCSFDYEEGSRGGCVYDHYELYTGEILPWMQKMIDNCED